MDFCFAYWIICFWLLSLFTLPPTYPDSVGVNTGFELLTCFFVLFLFLFSYSVIKHFLAFWHQSSRIILSFPSLSSRLSHFYKGVLLPFSREYCLKPGSVILLWSSPLRCLSLAMQLYKATTHTYIHTHPSFPYIPLAFIDLKPYNFTNTFNSSRFLY